MKLAAAMTCDESSMHPAQVNCGKHRAFAHAAFGQVLAREGSHVRRHVGSHVGSHEGSHVGILRKKRANDFDMNAQGNMTRADVSMLHVAGVIVALGYVSRGVPDA